MLVRDYLKPKDFNEPVPQNQIIYVNIYLNSHKTRSKTPLQIHVGVKKKVGHRTEWWLIRTSLTPFVVVCISGSCFEKARLLFSEGPKSCFTNLGFSFKTHWPKRCVSTLNVHCRLVGSKKLFNIAFLKMVCFNQSNGS